MGGGWVRSLPLALLFALALPGRAAAHAEIVRTDPPADCAARAAASFAREQPCPGGVVLPAAPGQVRILFSEPVSPVAGGISVLAPSGRRVDRGPARADGTAMAVDIEAAEEGTYQVRWRVVAEDTHAARGGFAFSVGRASAVVDAARPEIGAVAPLGLLLQIGARWLHFLGYALAFGTLAFDLLARPADRPRLGLARPAGPLAGAALNPQRRPLRGRPTLNPSRLVSIGVLLLLLAEPIALLGQTTSLEPSAPLDPELLADAVGSAFGRALGLRLAAALLLWTLIGLIREPAGRRLGWVALALGLALAVVDAASAHAASFAPPALGLLVGALHVAAMGLWLGALAVMVATRPAHLDALTPSLRSGQALPSPGPPAPQAVPPLRRRCPRGDARAAPTLRSVLSQLSTLNSQPVVALALVTLALTGAAMALVHLGPAATGLATPYGLALLAKLAVVILALALAFAAARRPASAPRLRALEALALAAVLALAGALVSLPPLR